MPTLRIVKLSRNFGKEIAVYAGFARASGDAVVLMDADLQHPPESIDALLRPWREGRAKVVHARRIAFDRGSTGREVLTRLFYRLFKRFSNIEIDPEAGDFIVVDRAVVEAFRAMPERHRFNRGLIAWAGFPSARVDVATESRHVGTSQWGTVRLFKLAVTALMSFGTLPLRVWSYIGTAVALLSLVYGAFILLRTLVFGGDVPGYPSIFVAVSFLAGVQLISLGIIGQYLGHVYAEVKRRPLYFEERLVGFEDDTGGRP